MNIRSITAAIVGTSVLAFDCAPALAQDVGPISGERMSGIAKVLASDDFEGRAPGTPGETKTVEYLVAQFKALGLRARRQGRAAGRRQCRLCAHRCQTTQR